jgi:hypothetical protein
MTRWAFSFFTHGRGARIITARVQTRPEPVPLERSGERTPS